MIPFLLLLLSAPTIDVWTLPATTDLRGTPPTVRQSDAPTKLYAARNESESFILVLQPHKKNLRNARIVPQGNPTRIGTPTIYRIGHLIQPPPKQTSGGEGPRRWSDPLLPPGPTNLDPGATALFWVTYHIPKTAKPGVTKTQLRIESDSHRPSTLNLRIEVFDFELPTTPSLPTLFPLAQTPLEQSLAIKSDTLQHYKPIYDLFASYRVGLRLLDAQSFVHTAANRSADADLLKEHLDYIITTTGVAALDFSAMDNLAQQPLRTSSLPQPFATPQNHHLDDLAAWLKRRNWEDRAYLITERPEKLVNTQTAIPWILQAPPNPSFESQTDHWAMPLKTLTPDLLRRFRIGASLKGPNPYPNHTVTASSSETDARHAFDASPFTAWFTPRAPTPEDPAWLQLDFEEAFDLEEITILWENDHEGKDIELHVSTNGRAFTQATTRWKQYGPRQPFDKTSSQGSLKYTRICRALRLVFRGAYGQASMGIAEIFFQSQADHADTITGLTIKPWLALHDIQYPALHPNTHPIEARLIPWICWENNLTGVLGASLNNWPASWNNVPPGQYQAWSTQEVQTPFLVYPHPDGLRPSLRIARLRDGLEDYEYLRALEALTESGQRDITKTLQWMALLTARTRPAPEVLNELEKNIQQSRITIGRTITKHSKKRS